MTHDSKRQAGATAEVTEEMIELAAQAISRRLFDRSMSECREIAWHALTNVAQGSVDPVLQRL